MRGSRPSRRRRNPTRTIRPRRTRRESTSPWARAQTESWFPMEPCQFVIKNFGSIIVKPGGVADGPEANTKSSNGQPEFYFYFPERGASQNPVTMGAAVSPSDFMLLRLNVDTEGKREAPIVAAGFASWHSTDSDIPFNSTKIGPAAYKVTSLSPLTPGEYGFLAFSYNNKADVRNMVVGIQGRGGHPLYWLFDFEVPGVQSGEPLKKPARSPAGRVMKKGSF